MCPPCHAPAEFRRHDPSNTVLYRIVREHMNTFFEIADARSGDGRYLMTNEPLSVGRGCRQSRVGAVSRPRSGRGAINRRARIRIWDKKMMTKHNREISV
jgi:hypothetical protein